MLLGKKKKKKICLEKYNKHLLSHPASCFLKAPFLSLPKRKKTANH